MGRANCSAEHGHLAASTRRHCRVVRAAPGSRPMRRRLCARSAWTASRRPHAAVDDPDEPHPDRHEHRNGDERAQARAIEGAPDRPQQQTHAGKEQLGVSRQIERVRGVHARGATRRRRDDYGSSHAGGVAQSHHGRRPEPSAGGSMNAPLAELGNFVVTQLKRGGATCRARDDGPCRSTWRG